MRKNKTLGAIMKKRTIINMMLKNHLIYQEMAKTMAEESKQGDKTPFFKPEAMMMDDDDDDNGKDDRDDEDDDKIDVETNNSAQVKEFKEKIVKILTDHEYGDKRASKLSIDDFLKLLFVFNQNGIHFK